jgi:hypothetical protein
METSNQAQNCPSHCLENINKSKSPHLYGLPKMHKLDTPFRPIVSSTGSTCYALADFFCKILSPVVGNTDSFLKNSEHFIKFIEDINLQNEDCFVSSDVVSLFTNVPVEEVLQVIRNRLITDPSFPECSQLQAEDVMELLGICLTTTYLQFEDKFYQQKEGMAMGNSLSLVVSNIVMNTEETVFDTADDKPAKWLSYVGDTVVVWLHGPATLQQFIHHLNRLRPTIKFTMQVEANDTLPFLDVLVMKGPKLATKVYRKPTHRGRYLHLSPTDHIT